MQSLEEIGRICPELAWTAQQSDSQRQHQRLRGNCNRLHHHAIPRTNSQDLPRVGRDSPTDTTPGGSTSGSEGIATASTTTQFHAVPEIRRICPELAAEMGREGMLVLKAGLLSLIRHATSAIGKQPSQVQRVRLFRCFNKSLSHAIVQTNPGSRRILPPPGRSRKTSACFIALAIDRRRTSHPRSHKLTFYSRPHRLPPLSRPPNQRSASR